MRCLFNYAVERDIIGASPVRVSAPKIKGSSLDVGKIASPHQVAALAAAMPGPLRLSVLLAAWCSLRQGEALGLQRHDIIGLESGSPRLRIERQWNQKAVPPGYTTPKSGAAREVMIPTALVPVIRDHLEITKMLQSSPRRSSRESRSPKRITRKPGQQRGSRRVCLLSDSTTSDTPASHRAHSRARPSPKSWKEADTATSR